MTVQVKDYTGQAKALFDQAREILGREHNAEEFAQAEKMMLDGKELQRKAQMLTDIGRSAAELPQIEETKAAPAGSKQTKRRRWYPQAKGSDFHGPEAWDDFMEAMLDAWESKGKVIDERLLTLKKSILDPDERKVEEEYWEKEYKGRKDLVENVGASGGFLVPTEFYSQLMAVDGESAIVRPRATKIRMRRRAVDIPVLDQTVTTAGIPHWFGGMQFYWIEEATSKTETNAKFRKITLVAHKLIGYTEASDELVEDSAISLGDFFNSPLGFTGGISWMEDYAFLQGTGAGQPLGVVNAGATITVARASVGTPIQYVDLVTMLENFLPTARGAWVVNQTCLSNLMQMQDPSATYIWQPNLQAGVPGMLFGYPVIFTEKLPTVGNAGDVLLADFRYYLIGDRQATTIESTQFYQWQYDLTSWRAVHRVDGQPWLSAPLTLQDGTAQVSPFVILGAKST